MAINTNEEVLNTNEEGLNNAEDLISKLQTDEIKVGKLFKNYDEVVKAVKDWCYSSCTPLILKGVRGNLSEGGEDPGRIQFICTHGNKRKSKATSLRPAQRVNYTGCLARININQQRKTLDWKITTARLDHDGHLIGDDVYGTYKHVKKLSEDDEEYARELINEAKILPRNLASCLSSRTGNSFTPKDAQNLIERFKRHAKDGGILEKHLSEIMVQI